MDRRRFLTISAAAFVARPALAERQIWEGRALGAEARVTLSGPRAVTEPALMEVTAILTRIEKVFSLYDPMSELSRLNAKGRATLSPDLAEVLTAADALNRDTFGLFDPSVQPLWQARARGETDPVIPGWDALRLTGTKARLARGQALTLNGIAQGYATDLVATALRARGLTDVLVNVGEFAGIGGPFAIGVEDPRAGLVAELALTDRAVATSSPMAMRVGQGGHILHPSRAPRWSTVSVEAPSAMLADGLSTALCLATLDEAKRITARLPVTTRLVDTSGALITL